jgi:hypothetical protein
MGTFVLDRAILIAGGGQSESLALSPITRKGLSVHFFEAAERVNDAPRAATDHSRRPTARPLHPG